jgi:dTDP-4-dehydrorhamnose 3,5-epimerase
MKFIETALADVILIEAPAAGDSRGYFKRTFCAREMEKAGLNPVVAQSSLSFNARRGTLRGMHFQAYPGLEDKLVQCVRGAILDVMVDIRPDSATFGQWVGYELSDSNFRSLYAPKGFAHGFQALTDDVVVLYHIGQFYDPAGSAGVRFDDPAIGVKWPLPPVELSPRDLELPLLQDLDMSLLGAGPNTLP